MGSQARNIASVRKTVMGNIRADGSTSFEVSSRESQEDRDSNRAMQTQATLFTTYSRIVLLETPIFFFFKHNPCDSGNEDRQAFLNSSKV